LAAFRRQWLDAISPGFDARQPDAPLNIEIFEFNGAEFRRRANDDRGAFLIATNPSRLLLR